MDETWKEILEKFRIKPPSEEALFYYWIITLVLIGILVIWQIVSALIRKRRVTAWEWRWLHKLAEAKDLSEDEAAALTKLAREHFPKHPQRLLQSIQQYDETVKKFLGSLTAVESEDIMEDFAEDLDSVRDKIFLKEFHAQDNLKSTRSIPPGQTIRVTIPTSTGYRFLHTTVTDNSIDRIVLHNEKFPDLKHLFVPGASFTGYYWRERDAGYQFPLNVTGSEDETHVAFTHTDEFSRKQRRHFFRVNVRLTGRFFIITEEDTLAFQQTGKFPKSVSRDNFLGKIVSLSGGGISFLTNEKIAPDDLLRTEILVRKGTVFSGIVGRVIRRDDFDGRFKFKVFIEFLAVTGKCRESIIQYVSQYQQNKMSQDAI